MRVMAKSRAYWKKWFSLSSPFNVTEWQEFPYCGRGLIFLTPYLIWSWEKFPQCIWMRVHNSWLNHSMSLTQPQSPNPKTYLPVTVIKLNNIKNVKNTNPSIATLHISLSQRQPLSSRHTHPSWMFPLDFPQTHVGYLPQSLRSLNCFPTSTLIPNSWSSLGSVANEHGLCVSCKLKNRKGALGGIDSSSIHHPDRFIMHLEYC